MNRRRQLGAPAPEVDLRRGWFPTQIGAADRGGQLDLKIVATWSITGPLGSTQHRDRWPACRKKPSRRETKRASSNGMRLRRRVRNDGDFGVRWLLMMGVAGLEARVTWPWNGVASGVRVVMRRAFNTRERVAVQWRVEAYL